MLESEILEALAHTVLPNCTRLLKHRSNTKYDYQQILFENRRIGTFARKS